MMARDLKERLAAVLIRIMDRPVDGYGGTLSLIGIHGGLTVRGPGRAN